MATPAPRQEVIDALNTLELHPSDKVDFLLVYLGEKPATLWWHSIVSRKPFWVDVYHSRAPFDQLAAWAATTGLPYEVEERTVNPYFEVLRGIEGRALRTELAADGRLEQLETDAADSRFSQIRPTLYFARNRQWLEKMMTAERQRDPKLYGRCYGFPETAIQAYLKGPVNSPRHVKGITPEISVFAQYGLSGHNNDEELATAKRWADAVHSTDPNLYEQMLDLLKTPPEDKS